MVLGDPLASVHYLVTLCHIVLLNSLAWQEGLALTYLSKFLSPCTLFLNQLHYSNLLVVSKPAFHDFLKISSRNEIVKSFMSFQGHDPVSHHRSLYSFVRDAVKFWGVPSDSDGKESACNVEDLGSIPALGRAPGEGNSYSLQYSGPENGQRSLVSFKLIIYAHCVYDSIRKVIFDGKIGEKANP